MFCGMRICRNVLLRSGTELDTEALVSGLTPLLSNFASLGNQQNPWNNGLNSLKKEFK